MKEIKFRVWDGLRITTSGIMYNTSLGTLETPKIGFFKLMQFIGLKDKNGIDIYEGDIVKYSDNIIKNINCEVPKLKYCFITNEIGYELENRMNAFCEVIGNIHENPELLK